MISFPNAKINIGLNVLEKRKDGYHNIESIFYPVAWFDAIEAIETEGIGKLKLTNLGNHIEGSIDNNLCTKVYNLLKDKHNLPSLNLWLLKCIPMGAGLGGGSADAAFFINLLNELLKLNLSLEELKSYASQIGSDCAFFIHNKPALISGKGDMITPIELDLSKYFISIIYPQIHIETKNAYTLITPHKNLFSLTQAVISPIHTWKEKIVNDFEEPIFRKHPQLAELKKCLYDEGAVYASMTGSGSALYGIFEKNPHLRRVFPSYKVWTNSANNAT
jgi:4-diphosphocytidyl-2-C-methyl-D-erythritol kinase